MAESILDSQGTDTQEIYTMVEELSQFSNICLCITSRISTIPPDCKRLDIPTLSMGAACHTFYHIHDSDERTNLVDSILEQLEFHPLSITLLATVVHHNKWDINRLAREWEERRTGVLRVQYNKSLADTIGLSLASPMFQKLGPDARDLLGVIAFYPRRVDENNVDRLLPDISNRTNALDTSCVLSLTYRSNGFITMLAPLRNHLYPKDPMSSPLLCTTKKRCFSRLSVQLNPNNSGFEETQWFMSEDVNIEHLLDVFTSVDANSVGVWDACRNFMEHLYWYKPRPIVLRAKIEGLPDDHPSKPQCLFGLSRLLDQAGNYVESKQHLVHALEIWRERGRRHWVARASESLAITNRRLGLYKEGVPYAKEALEIWEQLDNEVAQSQCLCILAGLLHRDDQLGPAEEAASQSIDLLQDKDQQHKICQSHRALGEIHHSKGGQRRPSTTSRQPSRLRPLPIGTISCPALITPWRCCFLTNTNMTALTLTSNTPSHTRPASHTFLVARCICRLCFCITNAGSKRRSRRPWAQLVFMRGLGPRRMWRIAGLSSVISKRRWKSRSLLMNHRPWTRTDILFPSVVYIVAVTPRPSLSLEDFFYINA